MLKQRMASLIRKNNSVLGFSVRIDIRFDGPYKIITPQKGHPIRTLGYQEGESR